MITFKRLSEMAREENMVASVLCMETGEIIQSYEFKNLIRAIKSSRHWDFTCQKYPWSGVSNSDRNLVLCYKIGTASEHYYTVWFKIESGIITDKGFEDITAKAKRISPRASIDW